MPSLAGLENVASVGSSLTIETNAALCTTAAQALADAIGDANIGRTVSISGNSGC